MVHLDHLLQPKPIRLRLFSTSQVTGSIEEPFALVKRLRTNWLLGVSRFRRRRIDFSTDAARATRARTGRRIPNRGRRGVRGDALHSLEATRTSLRPPVRWRYVCVCSPTSQVASSEVYPFPQVRPLLINWLFGRLRLRRRRIDFGHADVRQLRDGKSATRELLEDCRLKRRRIGSLPRGCKMTAGRRGSSTQPHSKQAAIETCQSPSMPAYVNRESASSSVNDSRFAWQPARQTAFHAATGAMHPLPD